MKKIRQISQNPIIILLVLFNLIFVSCNRDEIMGGQMEQNLSGEELFKSIIFVDGNLTPQINALSNVTATNDLTIKQLSEYRNLQNDFINFAKKKDADFFNNFKNAMYSKNPEIISSQIIEAGKILLPWLNSRLALKGLSVEKLKQEMQINNVKSVNDLNNLLTAQETRICVVEVLVFGVVLVAVGAVVIGLVYWTFAPENEGIFETSRNNQQSFVLNTVSIQIAENL